MRYRVRDCMVVLLVMSAAVHCPPAKATVVPFTEDFVVDTSEWRNAAAGALDWESTGGPDGSSFAAGTFNFVNSSPGNTASIFRAQDEFGSSAGAFEGNWISDGVAVFSTFIRHDAPEPLPAFVRFAGPANFPGAVAISFAPVTPHTWTELTFAIDPSNPQFVSFEGSDFNAVFSNIGHLQIGVSVSDTLAGLDQDFTFGIDKPTVLPEPSGLVLVSLTSIALFFCHFRRRAA